MILKKELNQKMLSSEKMSTNTQSAGLKYRGHAQLKIDLLSTAHAAIRQKIFFNDPLIVQCLAKQKLDNLSVCPSVCLSVCLPVVLV